jgi:phosphatidylglycerol:prolipoprotein diacylglycerol transferase
MDAMRQVLFRIPIGDGIPIYGFGMMLLAAFIACIWLAKRRAAKAGMDPTIIEDVAIFIFGGGIVGARICFLILHDGLRNVENPLDFLRRLISIWDGGIIFYGAVIGATLAYFVGHYYSFRFRKNLTILRMADVIAPTIAVGLMLGRIGCFLNGCCYGQVACADCPGVQFPLSAPARGDLVAAGLQTPAGFLLHPGTSQVWKVGREAEVSGLEPEDVIIEINGQSVDEVEKDGKKVKVPPDEGVADRLTRSWPRGEAMLALKVERNGKEIELRPFQPRTLPLQPTQIYETISMILVLLLLLAFDSIKRREGQVMALMMICYGIHRYVNEILRIDVRPAGFESYISVLLVVSGIGMMIALVVWGPKFPVAEQGAISPAQT